MKKIHENVNYTGGIEVISLSRDVQTNEVLVTLQTKYLEKDITVTIPRDCINQSGLKEISKYGFPTIIGENNTAFIEYFVENESDFPVINTYNNVGWHEINGKEYFLHRKAIIDSKVKKVEYSGNIDLSKKGTKKDFNIFFDECIKNSIGLQAVCAVSLASAVVGRFNDKDMKFIFHIEGTSSSGKTTSLMLAGSLWGNPQISPNGVIKNWNITGNKLIQSAGGNNGILIGLDELSMSNADNTQLTYLLTGGSDKQRMTNNENSILTFNTIFCTTGEIQFKNSNFGGISVRLFEVKNYNLTKDKEHAEKINDFISNNYGVIGFDFARALSAISKDVLSAKLNELSLKVQKRIKYHTKKQNKAYSPLFGRIADKIAAIALSAQIAKSKLGIDFDISSIVDFLICDTSLLEMGQEQSVEAMEMFFEEYTKNSNKFPSGSTRDNNIWGKSVYKNNELTEIVVLYNQFVKMMKSVGFPDTASLIKALKEKAFIKCEQGKNYSRRDVGNIKKTKVIVIDVLAVKGGADDEN